MHTFKSGILAYSRQTRVNEHHERPKLILNAIIIIQMLNAIIPRVLTGDDNIFNKNRIIQWLFIDSQIIITPNIAANK